MEVKSAGGKCMDGDFLFLFFLAAALELVFLAQLSTVTIPIALALQALQAVITYTLLSEDR
jgi:hypothetical protein